MTIPTVLAFAVPIIILMVFAIAITIFKVALKRGIDVGVDKLRASPSWPELLSMAKVAVRFAEQLKLNGKVGDVAEEVKAEAIKALQAFLTTQGWGSLDVAAIDALIEGAYNELKAELKYKVPEIDTWAAPLRDFTYVSPAYVNAGPVSVMGSSSTPIINTTSTGTLSAQEK